MEFIYTLLFLTIVGIVSQGHADDYEQIVWEFNNLSSIGGHKVEKLGNPEIIESPNGAAIQFNGESDALLINAIPLKDFSKFTIEVVFRPDSDGRREQRFFHIQEKEDHRILMETRITDDGQLFLDTFLKSGDSEKALFARNFLHPANEWYHAALVYDGKKMSHFVNGEKEMEAEIDFVPLKAGQTSIGCRLNRVYWFKGAIQTISVSSVAFSFTEFKLLPR